MTIKLITFDLDHTLWNPDAALQRAETASYQWLAERYPDFATQFSPAQFLEFRKQLRDTHPALHSRMSELRRVATELALRQARVPDSEATAAAAMAFDVFWSLRQHVDVFPETEALLNILSQHFLLGAISNGNASLKAIGLDHFFQFHLAADHFAAGKPAADMFLAALENAGTAPQESLHIGDHPVDDIHGAQAVGMKTLWLNLTQQTWPDTLAAPDFTATSLEQIIPLLLSVVQQ